MDAVGRELGFKAKRAVLLLGATALETQRSFEKSTRIKLCAGRGCVDVHCDKGTAEGRNVGKERAAYLFRGGIGKNKVVVIA